MMNKCPENKLWFLALLVCLLGCGNAPAPAQLNSNSGPSPITSKTSEVLQPQDVKTEVFKPEDFKTTAQFDLVNHQSGVIRQGNSRIETRSAMVIYTNGLMPGNVEGLKIQFFTKPITEADRVDVLENEGMEMNRTYHAILLLYLDQQKRIEQVTMTYLIPGTTVSRPVAGNPDDLKKYFSNYQFDGKRLQLESRGTYEETDANQKTVSLAWNVDIDLPVFDRRKK